MDATSPTTVRASAMALMDLVSASRIRAASVVKRAAWRAGASRATTARSARVSARNRSFWMASITRSTTPWMATAWPYCAAAFRQVTTTMTSGMAQSTSCRPSVNRSKDCWMTTGYSAVVAATPKVQASAMAMPRRCPAT